MLTIENARCPKGLVVTLAKYPLGVLTLLTKARYLQLVLLSALALFLSACSTTKPTVAPMPVATKAPSIALVLGGGGARGFAHVGVIKALEANGITPTLVVGTSVGSLIGSLYASGYSADRLERLALTTADSELLDFTLSNQGFIEGIRLKNFINTQVGNRSIEGFPIRFAAIAAERNSLAKAVFTTGNAGLAVQASCSVPNIFIAPRIPEKGGKKYIDGGVVSLVPVDSARDLGADIVIAVDITEINPSSKQTLASLTSLSSFWGLLESNLVINVNGAASNVADSRVAQMHSERARADIIILPDVAHISSLDTSQRRTLIEAGEQATTLQIIAIKQLIAEQTAAKYR